MSAYDSTVTGKITVDPPLGPGDFDAHPEVLYDFRDPNRDRDRTPPDVLLNARLAPSGPGLYGYVADAVKPGNDGDDWPFQHIAEQLQAIVDAFPDRTYTGRLIRRGADAGDIERFEVRGGRVVAERAVVTWPDGTAYDPQEGYGQPEWLAEALQGRRP